MYFVGTIYPTNIINAKVCENGCMFVTLSRKNYLTDLDETLQEYNLYIRITHGIHFISKFPRERVQRG